MESMIAVLSAVKATSGRIERLLRKNYDDRIARREDPNRWDQVASFFFILFFFF